MTLERKIELAALCGQMAFNQERPCIPALDPFILPLLTGPLQPGGAVQILNAWLHAWHAANLAAPLPTIH